MDDDDTLKVNQFFMKSGDMQIMTNPDYQSTVTVFYEWTEHIIYLLYYSLRMAPIL